MLAVGVPGAGSLGPLGRREHLRGCRENICLHRFRLPQRGGGLTMGGCSATCLGGKSVATSAQASQEGASEVVSLLIQEPLTFDFLKRALHITLLLLLFCQRIRTFLTHFRDYRQPRI